MGVGLGIGIGLPFGGGLIKVEPTNNITPILSGVFQVGEVISCSTGSWSGTKPIVYTYQWKIDGVNVIGETNDTYTIVLADDTKTLTCLVTATNDLGSVSQLSNARVVGVDWILDSGYWDDLSVWVDTSVWVD